MSTSAAQSVMKLGGVYPLGQIPCDVVFTPVPDVITETHPKYAGRRFPCVRNSNDKKPNEIIPVEYSAVKKRYVKVPDLQLRILDLDRAVKIVALDIRPVR